MHKLQLHRVRLQPHARFASAKFFGTGTKTWRLRFLIAFLLVAIPSALSLTRPELFVRAAAPAPPLHVLAMPFYSIKGNWDSLLTLNNSSFDALNASVTLYSLDGAALQLPDVSLQPNGTSALRLSELIAQLKGGEQFQEGSVEVRFNSDNGMALAPQVTVLDSHRGLSFDMEPPMGLQSSTLESLWWSLDEKTSGRVMICNTTSKNLEAEVKVEWRGIVIPSGSLSVSAHQTIVLDIEKILRGMNIKAKGIETGGMIISHNGAAGALIAHGVVENSSRRFASNLNFVEPPGQKTSVLDGTGLLLAHPAAGTSFDESSFYTPRLALKNTSNSPQTAAVTVRYTVNGGQDSKTLPSVSLSPHEVRMVDFKELVARLRNVHIESAGLEVATSGEPGSIIGLLTSVDEAGAKAVDVPLVSRSERAGKGGSHPFRLDDEFKSVAYLTNITAKPTKVLYAIFYEGGVYMPELVSLRAGETVAIDLLRLRDEQITDVRGRTLPVDLTRGQVLWHPHDGEALIGRVVAVDKLGGTASNFSCPNCCIFVPTRWESTPEPFGGTPGNSLQMTLYEYQTVCGQLEMGPYLATGIVTIYSDNTSVATVNSGNGMVSFVSPGSANIWWRIQYFYSDNISAEDCGMFSDFTEVPCPVAVVPTATVSATGATLMSTVLGDMTIVHFLTPKGGMSDNVTLTASITPNDAATVNQITWSGATQNPSNKLQATVSKASAGKTVVKLRFNGQAIKELRVWVVWATISSTDAFPLNYQQTANLGTINGGYKFTHTIQPSAIITDTNRPDLSGANTVSPPGGMHWTGEPLANGADKKWDNSRQIKSKWIVPAGFTSMQCCGSLPTGLAYPANDVEGNDDRSTGEENNDPYNNSSKLKGEDNPTTSALHGVGNNGETIELRLHFREFTRLEIAGTWHRISDFYLWRVHFKWIKSSGKWVNNSSTKALDNNGF